MSKHYLILGATGGIGSSLAKRLVAAGHRVSLGGRQPEKVEALARELEAAGWTFEAKEAGSVHDLFESAVARQGPLDGVAHCVGSLLLKPAHRTSEEEWMNVLHTNLTSSFFVVKESVRCLASGGSVVLSASAAAKVGLANHEAIAAAKAGVLGLMQAAAATYASRKIRFNCVCPGLVQTGLTESITKSELASKASVAMHPLGRLGEANEVASAIAWFLGEEQSWVTGQALAVDGGLSTLRSRGA